ncbi:MAG: hypothetical protein IKU34_11285 [Clostridia bacterium]|nr:hypothetical protein [Clostridia bacterium]
MPVHFDLERLDRVIDAHTRWWNGTLDRPLVSVTIPDAYDVPRRAPAPPLSQETCADFSWTPEQVIDAIDEQLSRCEFAGDAFPFVNFDAFGPGVLAAFCGAKLDNSSGRVWFWPDEVREIQDIHVKYDPDSKWVQRIKTIYRAGLKKWNGVVVMGFPDLGGVMDVAATFRGSENLLMDLYDDPDEVKRLCREIQDAWYAAYEDLAQVLAPQRAFSHWSGLVSRERSYITQCDFCYMIGNPMFREFVMETLREDTQRLPLSIYHLDGIGQLNHLDDILSLENLSAVQWVYGDGQPSAIHWLDVYRRIQAAGKGMMICGGPKDFLDVLDQIHGTPYARLEIKNSERELVKRVLDAR